jgi:hypothetical protein
VRSIFRRQIAIPQDHGSWVFIFSPLLIGIYAGHSFRAPTIILIAGALAGFLVRQPVTMIVKVLSGRRPRTDLPAALFWTVLYSLIGAASLGALILLGSGYVTYLIVPGLPVFAWHLWLVSHRLERRQGAVELIATGVLALAAPGAYWVGLGHYDPSGWWLWLLAWIQSGASILYAYLRLEQRVLPSVPQRAELLRMAANALAFTSFNVFLTLVLAIAGVLPQLIFIPYLVQWLEALWGTFHPAIKVKPVYIGVRQLIVSILWTVLFIVFWR